MSPNRGSLSWSRLLFRVLFVPKYRACWVSSLPPMPRHFGGPWWSFLGTGPRHRLRRRVHPLVSFVLLQSSSCNHLPFASPLQAPSFGSLPSSRHQPMESTCRRTSRPAFVPPAAFLTLSTASSSMCLAGLFHPATASRVSLQGLPPSNQPRHLVDASSPLAVGTELLLVASHQRQLSARRPQGFDPVRDPQPPWGG